MRNQVAKVVRLSALVVTGGALSFAVFFSNCGGSTGTRTGTAGNGAAGTTGSAGTTGTAGATGTAGVTGTGGAAGKNVCTPKPDLTCGASTSITLPDGHVTDFSMTEWSVPNGKYCNAAGLQGSIFSYSGGPAPEDGGLMSSNSQGVDAPAGNFRLTLAVGSAGYAGGGISFDGCVDASAFNALRFSAWLPSGDVSGCTFKAQLQTFEQRPTTQGPAGGCDPDAGASCYRFPASVSLTLAATPTTFTLPFAELTTAATHVNPIPGQLVGLQWQLESGAAMEDGGVQPSCMGEIRIDDIAFVTQ
jgi:hypothetical protein